MRLRPLQKSDLASVYKLGFEQRLFADNEAAWRRKIDWAVFENPYRDENAVGHVLEENGRIAGFGYYVYVPFVNGSWRGLAIFLGGLCVDENARGLWGLRLFNAFLECVGPAMAIVPHATEFGVKVLSRGRGVPAPASDFSMRACIDLRTRLERLISRNIPGPKWLNGALAYPAAVILRVAGGYEVKPPKFDYYLHRDEDLFETRADEINHLMARSLREDSVTIVRDASYLRWRYQQSNAPFRAIAVSDNQGQMVGLVILAPGMSDGDWRVMELIFVRDIADFGDQMVAAAILCARDEGAVSIFARAGDTDLLESWLRAGFSANRRPYPQLWLVPGRERQIPSPLHAVYSHGDHSFF